MRTAVRADVDLTWLGRSRPGPSLQTLVKRKATVARAEPDIFGKLKNKAYLDVAAKKFALGVEKGVEEDELVALELGVGSTSDLSDAQKVYKDKIKEKLQQRADELKAEEEELKIKLAKTYMMGREAYESGEYATAVRLLEQGMEEAGRDTQYGGEAQLWLALAYQACAREEDAIETCKDIEANHPLRKIKKQAEDLRYILEAPKLPIGEDERVKIPLIQSDTWRQKERRIPSKMSGKKVKQGGSSSYWDKADWKMPANPFIPDEWYYKVAWGVVITALVIYLNMNANH